MKEQGPRKIRVAPGRLFPGEHYLRGLISGAEWGKERTPALKDTALLTVSGDMSHSCPPHSPSHPSTHAHFEALPPAPYTNASCAPCHILPLTHLCSHVDTPTVLYTHPQIHKNPPPRTPKLVSFMPVYVHMEVQTQINAHSHTEDTWCTYTLLSMYSHAHSHTRTPVHTHTTTRMLTCIRASCPPLHMQSNFMQTSRSGCTLLHTHEHPNMPLYTLVHANGHSYSRIVQMHFLM